MKYIVITGDPLEGFTTYGPFPTTVAATNWAALENFDNWWLSVLEETDDFPDGVITVPNDAYRDEGEKALVVAKGTFVNVHWFVVDYSTNGIKIPASEIVAAHMIKHGLNDKAVVQDKYGHQYMVDKTNLVFKDMTDMTIKQWDEVERPLQILYNGVQQ